MKNKIVHYVMGYRNLRDMVKCYISLCDATFPEHLAMLMCIAKPLIQREVKNATIT